MLRCVLVVCGGDGTRRKVHSESTSSTAGRRAPRGVLGAEVYAEREATPPAAFLEGCDEDVHEGAVTCIRCFRDAEGRIVAASGGDDGVVALWEVNATLEPLHNVPIPLSHEPATGVVRISGYGVTRELPQR